MAASGLLLESVGCTLHTGQRCHIETESGDWLAAQVVGFRENVSYLMPFKKVEGLATGARVMPAPERSDLMIGPSWLGRWNMGGQSGGFAKAAWTKRMEGFGCEPRSSFCIPRNLPASAEG